MQEAQETDRGGAGAAQPPDQPRLINLVAVAGAVILIGLVAFALYRRSHRDAPPREPEAASAQAQAPDQGTPAAGTPITAALPVRLTPEASIVAERYRCICSCNDPLNVCTCTKTPGSRDMKTYVQELVNQRKSGKQVDEAMVARYGAGVLISNPPPSASPAPAAKKR